jgi:methionyl-tRNA formyltransferase
MHSSFRGPAPLHHTLLAGETTTGVTLQTLHPEKFDHGVILDQTPPPGFNIPDPETCDVPRLLKIVSIEAAQMLLKAVRNRAFSPPVQSTGWHKIGDEVGLRHAPKIKPEHRHIDWNTWTWDEISRRKRVLGPLWNTAYVFHSLGCTDVPMQKRIIFTKLEVTDMKFNGPDPTTIVPGLPFLLDDSKVPARGTSRPLFVSTCDGKVVRIEEMKVEGDKAASAYQAALKANMIQSQPAGTSRYASFYAPLQ